jgi:hypothetical protein
MAALGRCNSPRGDSQRDFIVHDCVLWAEYDLKS